MTPAAALDALATLVAAELPPARRGAFLDAVDDKVLRPFLRHPSRAEGARRLRVIEAGNKHGMSIYWTTDGRKGEGVPDWAEVGVNWCYREEGRIPTSTRDWDALEKAVTQTLGEEVK